MITKIDDTRFEVDLLDLYRTMLKTYIVAQILAYTPADMNQQQNHLFDLLFLTPSNMASNYYKTNFNISTMVVDGIQVRGKEDINGTQYLDITNMDDQVHFTFED